MSRSRGSVQARLEHLLRVQAQRLAGLRQAGQCRGADVRVTSENLNLIGLLRAGLEEGDMPGIPADAVGYGSKVWLQNLDNLETSAHRIMSGEAMDLEDGHISLDSALGSSLMGLRVGAKVEARTPGGHGGFGPKDSRRSTNFSMRSKLGHDPRARRSQSRSWTSKRWDCELPTRGPRNRGRGDRGGGGGRPGSSRHRGLVAGAFGPLSGHRHALPRLPGVPQHLGVHHSPKTRAPAAVREDADIVLRR